jgi:hypothetical protein
MTREDIEKLETKNARISQEHVWDLESGGIKASSRFVELSFLQLHWYDPVFEHLEAFVA